MIRVKGDQTSAQWVDARCGIPTASQFDRIITPKKLEPTKGATSAGYMHELIAEWVFGEPIDIEASGLMDRGTEMEDLARKAYEFQCEATVTEVGLCLIDNGEVGCSPDGLIGDDGGLEIKVPGKKAHIQYMLDPDALVSKYRLQVHGGLWVCDREWWDVMSYHPSLPAVIVRVERDEDIEGKIAGSVRAFLDDFENAMLTMLEMGVTPDPRPMAARKETV